MGANDLPEPLRRIRIVGVVVGMVRLGGFSKCRPETISVVVRKRTEQIVKGFHYDPRKQGSSVISPFQQFFLVDASHDRRSNSNQRKPSQQKRALMWRKTVLRYGRKSTEKRRRLRAPSSK